jgi:transcriptional regulator with XRE-family HTH domain
MAGQDKDFLEEFIAERAAKNPAFPEMVEAAYERRQLLRALAGQRESLGLSQTEVAARMGTSQSSVARLESGEADARLSTLERLAAALEVRLTWSISESTVAEPASRAKRRRTTARPV